MADDLAQHVGDGRANVEWCKSCLQGTQKYGFVRIVAVCGRIVAVNRG